MAEGPTSAGQTAAIREDMAAGRAAEAPSVTLSRIGLQAAIFYLAEGGLQEVTTLTEAALQRGAKQVTCDTDVMFVLLLIAAEPLKTLAAASKGEGLS